MSTPGRPPSELSSAQRREATRLRNHLYQTSPEYKARRKRRYARDKEYREACRRRAREAARIAAEPQREQERSQYESDVNAQLAKREHIGDVRPMIKRGCSRAIEGVCYTVPEAANIFCRQPQVVRSWIASRRMPAPNHRALGARVYTDNQVVALAKALVEHLGTGKTHFTAQRKEAIAALRLAMKEN